MHVGCDWIEDIKERKKDIKFFFFTKFVFEIGLPVRGQLVKVTLVREKIAELGDSIHWLEKIIVDNEIGKL